MDDCLIIGAGPAGLYAIGDITSGLSQMSSAFGDATTHVHNSFAFESA